MADLEQVHRGDASRPALVFVHGLGGHLFDTWVGAGSSRDDCWLHWVGQDTRCDTWTLGYDAALSRWKDQAPPLPDQATQVAHRLAVHAGLLDRKLVLVGHSMGGLVIKTLLTQTMAAGDASTQALVARVCGVVFIATPHQGSQLATLATAVGALLRTNPQVGDMHLHDAHLRQLGAAFRAHRKKFDLAVAVFAEGRDVVIPQQGWFGMLTRQVGVRVVDPSSSDPALDGVIAVPLAEDHFSICKPAARDSQLQQGLVDFVARLGQVEARQPAEAVPVAPAAVGPAPASRPHSPLAGPQDSRLQPAEGLFLGRDHEVQQVLDFLRGGADGLLVTGHEVSGVGGIGKTEVCKAALRRWLAEQPGQHAWLVPVADGAGLAGLLSRLAALIGIADLQSAAQLLQVLPAGLYYLDNLEGVAATTEGVEFLRAMQLLPGVRLLVSSRYSVPRVFGASIEIGVLPPDAALALFRRLWLGRDALPGDVELATFVDHDLGRHALSVVLSARLGDCHAYPDLVRRWREAGASLLQQPGDASRLGSLPASLRLTAEALGRTPGALPLWTVLALFATGAGEDDLAELEQRSGWTAARAVLVRHHVIQRQADGRWTLLPPLARYALAASHSQADGFSWAEAHPPVRAMFMARAEAVASTQSTPAALAARAWLIARFEALARLMHHEMQAKPPDTAWLQDLHAQLVNQYHFQVLIAADLLRQLSALLPRPGSALTILGNLESRLGRVDEARGLYHRALAQFEREQSGLGQANTLQALGDLESRQGRVDEARGLYDRALAQFEQAQDGLGQATTLLALGDLESWLGRMDEARGLYDRALALYEREQDGLGQANALQALGDLAREAGDPAAAAQTYQRALGLYAREQTPLGLAYTFAELARCLHTMRRDAESHQSLQQALDIAARTGTPHVRQYVLDSVEDVLGSTEAAQAWLARHAPPAAPPPA